MEKCVACLSTISLFDWDSVISTRVSYKDIFFRVMRFRRSDFQEMKWLCDSCGNEIQNIYNFMTKAAETDRKFRKEYCKQKPAENDSNTDIVVENMAIKTEPALTPTEESCNNVEELETPQQPEQPEIKFEIVDVDFEHSNEIISPDYISEDTLTEPVKKTISKSNVCDYCNKEMKTYLSKRRHILRVHQFNERQLCDECPATFADIYSLKKHKVVHKGKRKEYTCGVCNMKFLALSSLRGHKDIHDINRKKRFACDQCDKAFFQVGALNIHKRLHTGQLVECELCNKRYPRQVDLDIHMRSHTNEKPFKCASCEKTFKYRSMLYYHLRKEHFGFLYKCSYCSMQFQDEKTFNEHKNQHKSFRFKCAICDKTYIKKYKLKDHIKDVHNVSNTAEVDQLVISGRSEYRYRKMRKFTNVEYKKLTIEQHGSGMQDDQEESMEELAIEEHLTDQAELEENYSVEELMDD